MRPGTDSSVPGVWESRMASITFAYGTFNGRMRTSTRRGTGLRES